LSLAARIDFYSAKRNPSLENELEEKIRKIRAENPRPPQKRQEIRAKPKKKRRK
ncbi:MAG: rRNA biogenesis protein, partial [Methanosarcina mazei]